MRGEERVFEECKVLMGRLWGVCVRTCVCVIDYKTQRVMRRLKAMLYFPKKSAIDQRGSAWSCFFVTLSMVTVTGSSAFDVSDFL